MSRAFYCKFKFTYNVNNESGDYVRYLAKKTIMAAVGLVPSYQKKYVGQFPYCSVCRTISYLVTCRMISDFIFRSISYLRVGQSTLSPIYRVRPSRVIVAKFGRAALVRQKVMHLSDIRYWHFSDG